MKITQSRSIVGTLITLTVVIVYFVWKFNLQQHQEDESDHELVTTDLTKSGSSALSSYLLDRLDQEAVDRQLRSSNVSSKLDTLVSSIMRLNSKVNDVISNVEHGSPVKRLNEEMEDLKKRMEEASKKVQEYEKKLRDADQPFEEINWRLPELPKKLEPTQGPIVLTRTIHTIHGLWDDGKEIKTEFLDKWKDQNPDFNVTIHRRQECDQLVANDYDWLQSLYDSMSPIEKADLLRLLFVHKFGGVYTDLDVNPRASLEDTFKSAGFNAKKHSIVAFTETTFPPDMIYGRDIPIRQGTSEINVRVGNYVFYAEKGSDIIMQIILMVAQRVHRKLQMSEEQRSSLDPEYAVIYTTGPDAFTEAIFGGPSVTLMDGVLLLDEDASKMFSNSAWGTWRNTNPTFVNPSRRFQTNAILASITLIGWYLVTFGFPKGAPISNDHVMSSAELSPQAQNHQLPDQIHRNQNYQEIEQQHHLEEQKLQQQHHLEEQQQLKQHHLEEEKLQLSCQQCQKQQQQQQHEVFRDQPQPLTQKRLSEVKIIHYNRHSGVQQNLEFVGRHLNFTFTQFNPGLFNGCGEDHDRANKVYEHGIPQTLCDMADIIITGDVMTDARPLLLQLNEKGCRAKIIFELTNRFDWFVQDMVEYHDLVKEVVEKKFDNVFWVINNPWEEVYLKMNANTDPKARLIRPCGYSPVVPENKGDMNKVALVHLDEKIEKLFKDHRVPYIRTGNRYGGPQGLKRYKGFLEIPYQVSTMKFYENIAAGIIQLFPSSTYFMTLLKNDTIGFGPWGTVLDRFANWTEYVENYSSFFEPYVYYFDSVAELAEIIREKSADEIDTKNVRKNGPLFYAKITQQSLQSWATLFRDMGYLV
ncbi:hypothetical protein HDU76_008000 [Blyttiomyces sp. JEL0837]|nr:hypothetical protein HDU76_008000 [Blyttiomyces sp. JEL0837]